MLINPLNLPSLIRNSNGYHTAISICKCYDGYSQSLRIYLNTLAVKCLVFLTRLYFLYGHINYSNVIYIFFIIVSYIFCRHHRFFLWYLILLETMVLKENPIESKRQ